MTRLILVCVAVMFAGRAAHAQAFPNGADLSFNKVFFDNETPGKDPREPIDDDDSRFYLNYAHCECARKGLGTQQNIGYDITINMSSTTSRAADVYVGTGCDNDTTRPLQCRKIDSQGIANIDALTAGPRRITLNLFDVFYPLKTDRPGSMCEPLEQSAKIWLVSDANGDGTLDYFKSTDIPTTDLNATSTMVKSIDTRPPELPTNFKLEGGENSIEISWSVQDSTSIYVYQALCIAPGDMAVKTETNAEYQTQFDVCGQDSGVDLDAIDPGDTGTPVDTIPAQFKALDSAFICGSAQKTATSLLINGLENGKAYKVALLAIDQYGNADGVWFTKTVTPQPVTDLWEDIHDRGNEIDGGCLLSQTYGESNPLTRVLRDFRDTTLARTGYGRALISAYYATLGKISVEGSVVLRVIAGLYLLPLVVLALLWHALTLPGMIAMFALLAVWRRLRVKKLLLALGLVAPSVATADDFQPYWQTEEQEDASLLTFPEVNWHVGIKVGPYIPEIDLQTGLNALTGLGPYEAMFGDYYIDGKQHDAHVWQVLPMLDVDRVLWDGFGQVTVGGSIGYMQKSAYAYLAGTSEDDAKRERSTAGRNTFRLIPAAALVGYRFTYLDDMYGIPVVPYVRGGLSYYVWWMKAPNGNSSKICEDEMPVAGECGNENKAYGGSFGFQGSVGIAIRAERIDAAAATSMRSSGLMHAGFYAELSYAKVDGFGSDSKLSVGDNTWFAGVDFEF